MKQIEKLDLLVLDKLGYIPLNKEGAEVLFQVISMEPCLWGSDLTEVVIDRLIHHSHLLLFTGDSFRYEESLLHS